VTSQGADQQPAPRRGLLVIYSALMLALLLAALDQTIVVTANILDSTATTQVWGKLGDQFGRKYLFIAAIVIFLIRLGAVRAFPEHGRADRLPCAPRTWPARPR
jgi:MFS family permease